MTELAPAPITTPTKPRREEDVPSLDVIEDFACALQDKIILQGRMYVTEQHIHFSSVFVKNPIKIAFKDIVQLVKRNTLVVFPNAIEVITRDGAYLFTSFIFRDQTFKLLWDQWEKNRTGSAAVNGEGQNNSGAGDFNGGNDSRPAAAAPTPDATVTTPSPPTTPDAAPSSSAEPSNQEQAANSATNGNNAPTAVETKDPIDSLSEAVFLTEKCSHMKVVDTTNIIHEILDLDIHRFWEVFLSDTATFYTRFLGTQACTEISTEKWTPVDGKCCFTRRVLFRMALTHRLGPKSTRAVQTQRVRLKARGVLLFETSTVSLDVPSSDAFTVNTYWEVMPHPTKPNSCKLNISVKVIFTKFAMWKAIIEKSSLEGIKDFLTNWVVHAKREIHSLPAVAAPSGTVTAAPDTSTTPAVNGIVNTTAPTTPTAVQQPTAETPILPSTQPEPAVFPAEATDTKAQESWSLGTIQLNPTVVIGGGVLLLLTLLMFGIVSYVNLRLLNIESNLTADWRNKNLLLEEKVLFLEDFVQSVSETLTGKQGSLDAQWKHWKTREEFVTQVDRWKQKIEHIQSTLQQSQQVLRSVGQEMMDHATKSPSADKSNPK